MTTTPAEVATPPADFALDIPTHRVQYLGFPESLWAEVHAVTRSGALEHVHARHPSVESARVGIRNGKPVVAVVVNKSKWTSSKEPPVQEWPRLKVPDVKHPIRVLCVHVVA